jgi:hypothetical protein
LIRKWWKSLISYYSPSAFLSSSPPCLPLTLIISPHLTQDGPLQSNPRSSWPSKPTSASNLVGVACNPLPSNSYSPQAKHTPHSPGDNYGTWGSFLDTSIHPFISPRLLRRGGVKGEKEKGILLSSSSCIGDTHYVIYGGLFVF